MGLFAAYSYVYVPHSRYRTLVLLAAISSFIVVWTTGYALMHRAGIHIIAISYFEALTVTALVITLFSAVHMNQKMYDRHLEELVEERTRQLSLALDRSDSLASQNETLLRELHHRTKNNLQVIASLLSLRERAVHTSMEERHHPIVQARNQIYTIAAAHELFHRAEAPDAVRLQDYFSRSRVLWERTYHLDKIDLVTIDVEGLYVSMDLAVPVGLILHELVWNAGPSYH